MPCGPRGCQTRTVRKPRNVSTEKFGKTVPTCTQPTSALCAGVSRRLAAACMASRWAIKAAGAPASISTLKLIQPWPRSSFASKSRTHGSFP